MFYAARQRAKKYGHEFSIDRSDIIIPEYCPIFNIPLFVSETTKPCHNSPTLDRVDNDKGYVKGNVKVISHKANTMKQNNTLETLQRFIQYIKGELTS